MGTNPHRRCVNAQCRWCHKLKYVKLCPGLFHRAWNEARLLTEKKLQLTRLFTFWNLAIQTEAGPCTACQPYSRRKRKPNHTFCCVSTFQISRHGASWPQQSPNASMMVQNGVKYKLRGSYSDNQSSMYTHAYVRKDYKLPCPVLSHYKQKHYELPCSVLTRIRLENYKLPRSVLTHINLQ